MASGIVVGAVPAMSARAAVAPTAPAFPWDEWGSFDRAVQSAFDRLQMVGAAVAVVSADRVLHTATFGSRSLSPRRPVTNGTHFLVASTTKSMSSLLVATYVDQKLLEWDQPVVDAWPGFRAPTDAMTTSLRVRDLLGMASGLGEPPAVSTFHEGDPTAPQLLQSVVNLPVLAATPDEVYFYNNTVYAVGCYLPLLAAGVAPQELPAAYATAMKERVYGPAGMTGSTVTDDPRGLVDDYATGYGLDLRLRPSVLPYGPVGSYAPVGGTLATLDDMAAYVRLQLRRGVSVDGLRVVSAAVLDECHRPHVDVPLSAEFDPDAVSQGYGLGWITEKYRDGSVLSWHTGGIDGFTTWMGFLPDQDLGLVILANMNVVPAAPWFLTYVLNLFLNRRLGLNAGVADKALAAGAAAMDAQKGLYNQSAPVDLKATASFVGYYEGGYSVARDGRDLVVGIGPRRLPLRVKPDGTYVVSDGLLVGAAVRLGRDPDGVAFLEIVDVEKVRRTTG